MEELARTYRRWAEAEAAGHSPTYAEWAHGVANDPDVLLLLETLPRRKRQPNLVFAASRASGAPTGGYREWREWLIPHWEATRAVILAGATQTNEPGRCAVLLPALSRLRGPLALIEVGASAGLCLYPDRYSYRYRTEQGVLSLDPATGPSTVTLECRIPAAAVPTRIPEVGWRAGIDLAPIDPTNADQAAWLDFLVWPEQRDRRRRLRAALGVAARDPAPIRAGDLLTQLPDLLQRVPSELTPVVFHSAVLVYLDQAERAAFRKLMGSLRCHWLMNESPLVFPDGAAAHALDVQDGRFVLALDGEPLARTGPHGQSYEPVAH